MKKVKYVKFKCLDNSPVEDYLISVERIFVFVGEYFSDCETLEEIRDKFYNNVRDDIVIQILEVRSYTSWKNYDSDKAHEILVE